MVIRGSDASMDGNCSTLLFLGSTHAMRWASLLLDFYYSTNALRTFYNSNTIDFLPSWRHTVVPPPHPICFLQVVDGPEYTLWTNLPDTFVDQCAPLIEQAFQSLRTAIVAAKGFVSVQE